tara:strand:- start:493 stop:723 length:231 start_codon:yes stop_codon:yes gene_type:complete
MSLVAKFKGEQSNLSGVDMAVLGVVPGALGYFTLGMYKNSAGPAKRFYENVIVPVMAVELVRLSGYVTLGVMLSQQ